MNLKLIDIDELNEIMDNDNELIKDCFNDFITDYPQILKSIKEALDQKDAPALEKKAHALKGSLKYLAANDVADIAYKLENMGRNSEFEGSVELFSQLNNYCNELKTIMENF